MRKRNEKKKKMNIKHYIGIGVLVCCTIIGGYGILGAPASDQEDLEQELLRNEQALEQADAASQTEVSAGTGSALAATASAIGQSGEEAASEQMISVIGDSVFLGAAPCFQELQPNAIIDAKISRQVYQAIDVAKKLDKKDKLGNTVIISLGTNGNFNPVTGQELVDYLGTDRTIYWINAYGKDLDIQKEVNTTIRNLVKQNSNVHLISWANEGKKHPDWFYQDGVHLNTKGQSGFARFVQKNIQP